MGKLSRDKGKRGELEVAALLRQAGFKARRGQQFSGSPDSPDVVHSIPGIHIEVKRTEKLNVYAALKQAEADAGERESPVVLHRKNGEKWIVVMPINLFLSLVSRDD